MSYYIKDFIAESVASEKAELLIDSMELLNSINCYDYTYQLENIFNTIDLYSPADSINIIEAILLDSIYSCCQEYGVEIVDDNIFLYKLKNIYELSFTLFDLLTDKDGVYTNESESDTSDIDILIGYINGNCYIPIEELEALISDVDPDLIAAIEEKEGHYENMVDEIEESFKIYKRVKCSGLLNQAVSLKPILDNSPLGYNFNKTFEVSKDILFKIEDIKQKVTEFVILIVASKEPDNNLKNVFNENIDSIIDDETDFITVRKLGASLLMGICNE